MKKFTALILLVFTILVILPQASVSAAPKAPKVSAQSWILIDMDTGYVMGESNSDKEMHPASTTKIISYLVISDAIEDGELSLDDQLVFTADMQSMMDPDSSHIELKAGERMSVEDLIRGMLIASGNDAAILLSTAVSGSEKKFVEKMNEKAEELGLDHSHFTNSHGITDSEHYATAADLAKASREAMKDDFFREVVGSQTLTIKPTNKTENERYFINTNNLVSPLRYSKYYYKKATGIKTGYTEAAGSCLVASAKDGERELICVVLKSETSHEDAKALLEYGFDSFKRVQIVKKGDLLGEREVKQGAGGVDHIRAVAAKNIYVTIPEDADADKIKSKIKYNDDYVYAPIKKGDALGTVTYSYGGQTVSTMEIVAETDVKRHPFGFLMSLGETIWGNIIVRIIVYMILIVIILFILLVIYGFYRSIKRSRSRKRRRKKYRPSMY